MQPKKCMILILDKIIQKALHKEERHTKPYIFQGYKDLNGKAS